jgi:hypothetical protein
MRFRDFRRRLCQGAIDFEAENTWPQQVSAMLSRNLDLLASYEARQTSIDALCGNDVIARNNPPENEFQPMRDQIIEELDSMLADVRMLGFHCTKLLPHEKEDIRQHGLAPLTKSLVARRISNAVSVGYLSNPVAQILQARNEVSNTGRADKCWFVNMRSCLAEESGVKRLFRCWGGEALYVGHEPEYDPEIGPVLRNMGEPNIVVAALPVPDMRIYGTLGEKFASAFLRRRHIQTTTGSGFETRVYRPIPASWLIDLVPLRDERFEELTKESAWRERL